MLRPRGAPDAADGRAAVAVLSGAAETFVRPVAAEPDEALGGGQGGSEREREPDPDDAEPRLLPDDQPKRRRATAE